MPMTQHMRRFARDYIRMNLVENCTIGQLRDFRSRFSPKEPDKQLDDIIASIPAHKVDYALRTVVGYINLNRLRT